MDIIIHKNGNCTVRGVSAKILRSILCAAALHGFDTSKQAHAKVAENRARAVENEYGLGEIILRNIGLELEWYQEMRQTIFDLEQAMLPKKYRKQFLDATLAKFGKLCGICGALLKADGTCFREAPEELVNHV